MKKVITLLFLAPLALVAQDYDYSPAINRNLEMLFDNYLIDYNRLINIDPNTANNDTIGLIEVLRNGMNHFTEGREFVNDTLRSQWTCTSLGNKNTVDITQVSSGTVIQRENIYFDANGRDTLIEVYLDTTGMGNLAKAQDFKLFYNNFGLDSAAIVDGGGGIGNEVYYNFRRNAVGKLDSLVAAITFAGAAYPIQTLIYFENVNGSLDSINLFNNLTGEVEEQVRAKSDANGKVYEFSIYELDNNDEWSIYDTYILSTETFFNVVENAHSFDFKLYPNPSQNEIQLDLAEKASYRIFHLSGTLMAEGEYTGQRINIEDLADGVYVMNLELQDGTTSSQRFVVKH